MVVPGLVTPVVSVDNTNGHWTYTYPSQKEDYFLLGFSYVYYYIPISLSDLSANGTTPGAVGGVYASIKLNACIPDDVECKIGNLHFARYRVSGSLSGSFSSTTGGYIFSYGKYLKTPVLVPNGNDVSLESKINDFFNSFWLGATGGVEINYYLCQINPGSARMLIR